MMGLHVIYVFTHDSIASVRSRRHKIFQSLPSFVIQLSERFLFIVHWRKQVPCFPKCNPASLAHP
jgi:hypothetical protein